jgi:hypothetical protein
MNSRFDAGREFIYRQGRVLEQRLFATCFEGAPAAGVSNALRGHRNEDGGFGYGLEPDKRCPASLPIDVEVAFQAMAAAGQADPGLVRGACDYLARVADQAGCGGAVPLAFPVIEDYPRAAHWTEWTYQPGLNPTAGLVGWLWSFGAEHPWIDQAARYCWDQIESADLPTEVHSLSEVLVFLERSPERDRADAAAARVRRQLDRSEMFLSDPDDKNYGLSPLSFAPLATSRWRGLFSEEVITAFLDRAEQAQEADGGWPIRWDPPSQASLLEWRGRVTLDQLRTLSSYGRL